MAIVFRCTNASDDLRAPTAQELCDGVDLTPYITEVREFSRHLAGVTAAPDQPNRKDITMAQATLNTPPPAPPATVTLDLTLKEAQALQDVLHKVGGDYRSSRRRLTSQVVDALNSVLPSRHSRLRDGAIADLSGGLRFSNDDRPRHDYRDYVNYRDYVVPPLGRNPFAKAHPW